METLNKSSMKEDFATVKLVLIALMAGFGGWFMDNVEFIDKILAVVLKFIMILSAIVVFATNYHNWKNTIKNKWKKGKKNV